MEKIDKLILKILQLNPQMVHEHRSNMYHLIYKNITFSFWNMDFNQNIGLVRINDGETYKITEKTRISVLDYFKKSYKIDELLNIVNKDLRKEKLLRIEEKII